MKKSIFGRVVLGALLASASISATMADSATDLGGKLTPVGAEAAGNADGTIPAWEGGITAPPAGWNVGDQRPDPFASDSRLFTIDKSNVDKYADKLTAAQLKMLRTEDGYRMNVYPTHRSCAYPKSVYDATRNNMSLAKLDGDGNLLDGKGGFLFPVPKTGAEVIWNHKARYQGVAMSGRFVTAAPTSNGNFALGVVQRTNYSLFHDTSIKTYEDMQGIGGEQLNEIITPISQAGTSTLIREPLNGDRQTWRYLPAQRRVRQMPNFAYDTPIDELDGLMVADQANMFNGNMDKYDWKLVGKQELFIAYNDWELNSSKYQYKDILKKNFPNPDQMRYELHRVWKVEATLRPGERHLYSRRVFYVDEDSWIIAESELYDGRGQLWRSQTGPIGVVWELPACVNQVQFHFDLNAHRYVASQLKNQEPGYRYLVERDATITDEMFTPGYLRQTARR